MDKILIQYDKIFIDTSSFMLGWKSLHAYKYMKRTELDESLTRSLQEEFFINILKKTMKNIDKKVSIPIEVIHEIEKAEKSINDKKRSFKGRNALKILNSYKADDMLDVFQGENYPFTDNIFITIMFRFMTKYNICLITQDRALSRDVVKIKQFESIKTYKKIDAYLIGFKNNEFTLNKKNVSRDYNTKKMND